MYKILYSLSVCVLSSLLVPSSLLSSDGGEKYKCLYSSKSMIPHVDDPFKARPLTLTKELISTFPETTQNFYNTLLFTTEEEKKKLTDNRKKIGDFLVDFGAPLGNGVEGSVYLAQHTESNIFTAVKETHSYTDIGIAEIAKNYSAYKNHKKLERCFGLFVAKLTNHVGYATYLFTPLIDGKDMCSWTKEDAGVSIKQQAIQYDNLRKNVSFVEAVVNEITYCYKRGVTQCEPGATNCRFTYDKKYFVLVDIDGWVQEGLDSSKYNASYDIFYSYQLLGIRSELNVYDNYSLKSTVPDPVLNFHKLLIPEPGKKMCVFRFFSLAQFAQAVALLKTETEEYFNNPNSTIDK